MEWETPDAFESTMGISTQDIENDAFESTIQGGPIEDLEDELDDAAIERSIAEINEAIRRSADRKSTRLNSSHLVISYAVFCLKKKKKKKNNKHSSEGNKQSHYNNRTLFKTC